MTATTAPYSETWSLYREAGWTGVLPLPLRAKANPPKNTTGEDGYWPSAADCIAWAEGREGLGNIALRLPPDVVGIDVDAYGDKPGAATLAARSAEWGELPASWRVTSRSDGVSGIRLYRVPEGLQWPGQVPGGGIEIIQHRHRYAVTWPSIHPEGMVYRWIDPTGATVDEVPRPDELPELPEAWVAGLTSWQTATNTARLGVNGSEALAWLTTGKASEPECRRMIEAAVDTVRQIGTHASSHEAARDGVLRLVRLHDQGHFGVTSALLRVQAAFIADVTSGGRETRVRDEDEARHEWFSILVTAVGMVAANPAGYVDCDCSLDGLIDLTATPTAAPGPAGTSAPALPFQPLPGPALPPAEATDSPADNRTSWWPRDLTSALTGEWTEPAPCELARADGVRLWYAGKINGLLGESESGKSWLAFLGVKQALAEGRVAAVLDFEDDEHSVTSRLRSLGVTDEQFQRFYYIQPEETLHRTASEDLAQFLEHVGPDLVVLDGVNAAMTLLGLDLEKNRDATIFAQSLLKPLAARGGTVVVVDHLPKNREGRGKGGIGAQAKRAMMSGCAIMVEVNVPFGRGRTGRLKLTVDKDRPGHVRAIAAGAKDIGTAVLKSDLQANTVTVSIEPAKTADREDESKGDTKLRVMREISKHVATIQARATTEGESTWFLANATHIKEAVRGNATMIGEALSTLVSGGWLEQFKRGTSTCYRIGPAGPYSSAAEYAMLAGQKPELPTTEPVDLDLFSTDQDGAPVPPNDEKVQHATDDEPPPGYEWSDEDQSWIEPNTGEVWGVD